MGIQTWFLKDRVHPEMMPLGNPPTRFTTTTRSWEDDYVNHKRHA
jgi:hypothetical protein